jgi:hypothetical protein
VSPPQIDRSPTTGHPGTVLPTLSLRRTHVRPHHGALRLPTGRVTTRRLGRSPTIGHPMKTLPTLSLRRTRVRQHQGTSHLPTGGVATRHNCHSNTRAGPARRHRRGRPQAQKSPRATSKVRARPPPCARRRQHSAESRRSSSRRERRRLTMPCRSRRARPSRDGTRGRQWICCPLAMRPARGRARGPPTAPHTRLPRRRARLGVQRRGLRRKQLATASCSQHIKRTAESGRRRRDHMVDGRRLDTVPPRRYQNTMAIHVARDQTLRRRRHAAAHSMSLIAQIQARRRRDHTVNGRRLDTVPPRRCQKTKAIHVAQDRTLRRRRHAAAQGMSFIARLQARRHQWRATAR